MAMLQRHHPGGPVRPRLRGEVDATASTQLAERVQTMTPWPRPPRSARCPSGRSWRPPACYADGQAGRPAVGPRRGPEAQAASQTGFCCHGHDGHARATSTIRAATSWAPSTSAGLGSGYTDLDPQSKINEQVGVDEYPAMVRTQQFTHPDVVLDELEKGRLAVPHGLLHQRQRHREPLRPAQALGRGTRQAGVQRGHGHRLRPPRPKPCATSSCR